MNKTAIGCIVTMFVYIVIAASLGITFYQQYLILKTIEATGLMWNLFWINVTLSLLSQVLLYGITALQKIIET